MRIVLTQIKESFIYAISSLVNNKLRTFLSLLGITIGIFIIISIFSIFDSLEKFITENIGNLGDDVIYIQKWPWVTDGRNFPWWKYVNRPVPTYKEYNALKNNLKNASAIAFISVSRQNIKSKTNSLNSVSTVATTYSFNKIRNYDLDKGRYFTKQEVNSGKNVAIIGFDIAESLFKNKTPIGRTIKISGIKYKVIGVFNKQGINMGEDIDHVVFIPVNSAYKIMDINSEASQPYIMVKCKKNSNISKLKLELKRKLRKIRHLPPNTDDNFALNQTSLITNGIKDFFKTLNTAGLIIGIFSILIGGFGIANIMFVSVKERTKIIGIQKALGAKNYFILLQFLFESSILSAIGGIIGLILIFVGFFIINHVVDFIEFHLSMGNIIEGLLISIIIGLVAGFVPAKNASELVPVEAMNSVF
jgi:putative ABC transport system permease protein